MPCAATSVASNRLTNWPKFAPPSAATCAGSTEKGPKSGIYESASPLATSRPEVLTRLLPAQMLVGGNQVGVFTRHLLLGYGNSGHDGRLPPTHHKLLIGGHREDFQAICERRHTRAHLKQSCCRCLDVVTRRLDSQTVRGPELRLDRSNHFAHFPGITERDNESCLHLPTSTSPASDRTASRRLARAHSRSSPQC